MVRGLFIIVVLGLAILGFNNLVDTQIVEKLNPDLAIKQLEAFRGKIYSPPAGSVFGDFFVDDQGNLYGIEAQAQTQAGGEVTTQIKELKDSNQEIEIKGLIEEDSENYGEKKIIIEKIETITEETEINSCEDSGGSVELKEVCVYPN